MVKEVCDEVTRPRNGSVFPFPISFFQNWRKQRHFASKLALFKWDKLSLDEVLEKVHRCCVTLSELLHDQEFFFGSTWVLLFFVWVISHYINNILFIFVRLRPTELDALVFGHLFVITTTPLPNHELAAVVKNFPNLLGLCKRIEKQFFAKK